MLCGVQFVSGDSVVSIVSQLSFLFARFSFVPTTVLPTRCMLHWILSGLGALPWLDLCVCVWTELQLLLSCCVFGKTFLNAGLPGFGPRDCVGIGFGCSMSWRVRWVCVLVVVSSP